MKLHDLISIESLAKYLDTFHNILSYFPVLFRQVAKLVHILT